MSDTRDTHARKPDPPGRSHGRKSIRASLSPSALLDETPTLARAWQAQVITLYPELFPGPLGASLTGRALDRGLWQIGTTPLRAFGEGRHRNVDDTPAGGGAGMVLRPDVMARAIDAARNAIPPDAPLIYLSPRGSRFDQSRARALADGPGAVLICGRFEGLDQRVIDAFEIEEISLGDFVMTGGEIAAYALLDATIRLLPGVLGNAASLDEESFAGGLLEHPHFTRPATWRDREIPSVLLSGDHDAVARWRRGEAERLTRLRRPDLWAAVRDDSQDD